MIEQQVQIVVDPIHGNSLLPFQKGEPDAQFKDERLHFPQNRGFQVLFRIGILEAEEVKQVRIAKDEIRRQFVFLSKFLSVPFQRVFPVSGKSRTFKEHGLDFCLKRPGVPSLDAAHLCVEVAFQRIIQGNDVDEMGPAQLCHQ